MRVNPRTVLVAALQAGPCTRQQLAAACREALFHLRWAFHGEALLDRHLGKLLRQGQVMRSEDGRYQVRERKG